MYKHLIFIIVFIFPVLFAQKAEAAFPFNMPTINYSYKACVENGEIYAAVMEWDVCPSMFEVLTQSNPNYTQQLVKRCKHNGDVYDLRNTDGGRCHFDNGAPNLKLQQFHEKEVDGGHDCDLDEDDDLLYVGSGGNVM